MLKKAFVAGGLMLGLGFAAVPAQATVVTNWTWTVNAAFSAVACEGGGTACLSTSETNAALSNPSHVDWGVSTGFGRSSLDLGGNNGFATGSIATNAPSVLTSSVVAGNHTVTGPTLQIATIHDVLNLQATSPFSGALLTLPALDFVVVYDETNNFGTCAAPSTFQCADILAVKSMSGGTFDTSDPNNVFISQALAYMGENYQVKLFLTGLIVLNKAECDSVNTIDAAVLPTALPSPGCLGFISQEGDGAQFDARLQILDAGPIPQVPEPVTLSLFGAGLAGTAFARRRKSKKA